MTYKTDDGLQGASFGVGYPCGHRSCSHDPQEPIRKRQLLAIKGLLRTRSINASGDKAAFNPLKNLRHNRYGCSFRQSGE